MSKECKIYHLCHKDLREKTMCMRDWKMTSLFIQEEKNPKSNMNSTKKNCTKGAKCLLVLHKEPTDTDANVSQITESGIWVTNKYFSQTIMIQLTKAINLRTVEKDSQSDKSNPTSDSVQ